MEKITLPCHKFKKICLQLAYGGLSFFFLSLDGSNWADWVFGAVVLRDLPQGYERYPTDKNSKSVLTSSRMKGLKIRVFFAEGIPEGTRRPPLSAAGSCRGSWPDPVGISVTRAAEARLRIAMGCAL